MERGGNLPALSEPSSAKSVNLFERQWRDIDEAARRRGLSRSEFVRWAVDNLLDHVSKTHIAAVVRRGDDAA